MILGPLDTSTHPWLKPISGQVRGEGMQEGSGQYAWARGSVFQEYPVDLWVKAWQALGGSAALSWQAARYLVKQLQEIANNPDYHPMILQWAATADTAPGSLNTTDPNDGWFTIDDFEPDYESFIVGGWVKSKLHVTATSPIGPRGIQAAYWGGALASSATGAAINLLSFPIGSTLFEANFTRTGAQGAIPCIAAPSASPMPWLPSATIAQIYQGGVHVYDTINTGTNPVPTGGTFVNANWVEVFHPNHVFAGDCVITNGLHLLLIQQGQGPACTNYFWSTGQATPGWFQWSTFNYHANDGVATTNRNYSLVKVGPEECSIDIWNSNSRVAVNRIRLQRGREEARVEFTPLSESNTSHTSLYLNFVSTPKIVYTDAGVCDNVLNEASPTPTTDYLWAGAFVANSGQPYIGGWLWQNPPASEQPKTAGTVAIGVGDSSGPAQSNTRVYAFFCLPFGVNATYSPANLQGECEGGTLGTGWSSVVDANASAGNTAQLASGTAAGNNDTVGSSWTPPAGNYILAVRYRNSGAPSNATEVQVGALIGGAFTQEIAVGSGNGSQVAYKWLRSGVFALSGSQTFQFQLKSGTSAATVNHFFDEIVLLPVNLTTDNRGPQDLWQQFMFDRSVAWRMNQ